MMDSLGDRMKNFYEGPARHYLTRRTPVVIRLDGRAFHTLTRQMQKPYDLDFIDTMTAAAKCTFEQIQGCKIAYMQSDEVSFVLTDYDTLTTEAWFGYNKSKIESIAASIMSVYFNTFATFTITKPPVFDARAFNVPESEVANYLLWRAKDWHRNSVQMLAQANFPHQALQGKSIPDCLTMLDLIDKPWDKYQPQIKNGVFIVPGEGGPVFFTTIRDRYEDIAKLWESVNERVDV